jgi:hypothetical protein
VHKETIDKIPGALPGRDSVNVEVYGMEGIPANMYGLTMIYIDFAHKYPCLWTLDFAGG